MGLSLLGQFKSDRFLFSPTRIFILFDKKFRVSVKSLLRRYKCYVEESFYKLAKSKICVVF